MENKIVYTDWAVANVFKDGTIEMHKDLALPQYDFLREKILDHEKAHDFEKGLVHNLKVDFFHYGFSFFELFKFMAKRPKTWIQILPIYFTKTKGIIYDKNMLIFYSIIILAVFVLIKTLGG